MKVYGGGRDPERVRVGVADYAVTVSGATLTTSGLGSCVGVAVYDEAGTAAGLAHVMLPEADRPTDDEAKFADTGVAALRRDLVEAGADEADLRAKMAGGSEMLSFTTEAESIGVRNVRAVRSALDAHGVPLVGEDVGGSHGRSLSFHPERRELVVRSAKRGRTVI